MRSKFVLRLCLAADALEAFGEIPAHTGRPLQVVKDAARVRELALEYYPELDPMLIWSDTASTVTIPAEHVETVLAKLIRINRATPAASRPAS